MSAPTIRSDYEGLKGVADSFNKNGESLQGINQQLKSNLETLRGGDWIGQGAQAFFAEMNDAIMPSMNRLQQAMVEAGRITKQISDLMKQAEQDSSSCFRM